MRARRATWAISMSTGTWRLYCPAGWSLPGLPGHLDQLAGVGVIHEPPHPVAVGEEGRRADPIDGGDRVLVRILEAPQCPRRALARVGLQPLEELVVLQLPQGAVGVMDEDDLVGAEETLTETQRPDHVVGDDSPGVADDVRLTLSQPEHGKDVHPRVHTGDDRQAAGGSDRQVPVGEGLLVGAVVLQQLVGVRGALRHPSTAFNDRYAQWRSSIRTDSPGLWASAVSPGPKLMAGTPRAASWATSVQPCLCATRASA